MGALDESGGYVEGTALWCQVALMMANAKGKCGQRKPPCWWELWDSKRGWAGLNVQKHETLTI